jgi:acyl-coenzyme A thioesterase PaaI-like protein
MLEPFSDRTAFHPVDPTRCLRADGGRALAQLELRAGRLPLPGPAAIVTLASAAVLAATTSALAPDAVDLDRRPVTTQVSVNLFRHADAGTLTAEAETIYRGRSTVIVDVKVRDEAHGLVATLVFTQLAPRDPAGAHAAPARLAS